jgi:hypothetical protein
VLHATVATSLPVVPAIVRTPVAASKPMPLDGGT